MTDHGIRLRDLRAFKEIVNTRSLSAAAERLFITQPAISKRLQSLEEALGLRLIDRQGGGPALPTEAGLAFFRAIENTLGGIDAMPDIARDIRQHTRVPIRLVATPPLLNSEPMMRALRSFGARHPTVRYSLESRHRIEMEECISTRQVDLGLGMVPVDNPQLLAIPFLKCSAVAVVRSDNPLAQRTALSPAELRGEPVILPAKQPLRDRIDAALRVSGEQLIPAFEASSTVNCCMLCAQGFGVAVCDPLSPSMHAAGLLKLLRWTPAVDLEYGAIVYKHGQLDPVLSDLLGILQAEFQRWEVQLKTQLDHQGETP